MLKAKLIAVCFFACLLTACVAVPKLQPRPAINGQYVLDPAHSSVIVRIRHAGLSNYTMRFDEISVVLDFNSLEPEKSQVDIKINPNSLSTGNKDFDQEITMGLRYFNAKKFPAIRFTSTQINQTGGNTGEIKGDLSFRGQTHPIVLKTVFSGAGKSFGHKGKTLGFSASGTFNRSVFGLTHLLKFGIGDEISLTIETEFNEND